MRSTRRNITGVAAVVLCVALTGCSTKTPPREGGAAGSKAEKARKDAEALAMSAVSAGADAQAKAVPEVAVRRDMSWFGGRVTISRETWEPATHAKTGATAKPPPAASGVPAPNAVPPLPTGPPSPEVTKGPPAPKTAARTAAVVRERVVSTLPYATEAEAEDDALTQARDLIEKKLAALDPPVRYKPSIGEVKAEFIRKDSRTVRAPDAREKTIIAEADLGTNLVFVEYDVEVTVDQVRELRAQERVSSGLRVLGMLFAIALAGFLFLRADEWTKGYLTSWLAIGAVVLAGGAAAAFLFV